MAPVSASEEPLVDATAVEEAHEGILATAVDDQVGSAAMVVADPQDRHDSMVAMDAHDVELLLRGLVDQVQSKVMRKWVYELPDGTRGLSVHGVEDITQRMNWTGKCALRVLPETLTVEREQADAGNGMETWFVATIFAEDQRTGAIHPGVSTEPQMMKLRPSTAKKKRDAGATIGADNRVFDVFARTKAVGKAKRNALAAHIPEEVEQTVIAMAAKRPELVERIRSQEEAKLEGQPPALDTDEARAKIKELEGVYAEIRELGDGRGRVLFTPGKFASWLMQSQHSMEALGRMEEYLRERLGAMPAEIEREVLMEKATKTARDIPCPKCEAEKWKPCKGTRGVHGERVAARAAQWGVL